MQLWWALILVLLAGSAGRATASQDAIELKDETGKTQAVLVICNDCRDGGGAGKTCSSGVEDGWLDGQPCGQCLIRKNAGSDLKYDHDLHISGKLQDETGKPIAQQFVKLFLSNGWTVRSATSEQGNFRMVLGSIQPGKGKPPVVKDLGVRVESRKQSAVGAFSMFLLQPSYQPCPPEAAAPPATTSGKKKHPH